MQCVTNVTTPSFVIILSWHAAVKKVALSYIHSPNNCITKPPIHAPRSLWPRRWQPPRRAPKHSQMASRGKSSHLKGRVQPYYVEAFLRSSSLSLLYQGDSRN